MWLLRVLVALAFSGTVLGAPVIETDRWNPIKTNAVNIFDEPNQLGERGDQLYEKLGDASFWNSITDPSEINARVQELMYSPKFIHKLYSFFKNRMDRTSSGQDTGRQDSEGKKTMRLIQGAITHAHITVSALVHTISGPNIIFFYYFPVKTSMGRLALMLGGFFSFHSRFLRSRLVLLKKYIFSDVRSILGVELKPASGTVWRDAIEDNLKESKLFSSAAGDIIKAFLRVYGWMSLDVLLYQGNGLFKF